MYLFHKIDNIIKKLGHLGNLEGIFAVRDPLKNIMIINHPVFGTTFKRPIKILQVHKRV